MGEYAMNTIPILIKALQQKNNHTFTIEWSDGIVSDYRLSDVQSLCPCAKCLDHSKTKGANTTIDHDVRALRIFSIGRYAMRIQFTSGCSTGIYSYALLRQLSKKSL